MSKTIENDEQYKKSLDWLLEKAEQLEHPLLKGEERAKLMATYDYVSKMVQDYNDKFFAGKQFPPDPEPEQEKDPAVDLSDWI